MKTLSKKYKYIGITLLLLALTLICVACGGKSYKLHIEAPTQTEAELGTYVVPKYDVVNEYGTVMAGYEVTLLSVKDSNGNSVGKTNNRIEITKAGIYELEYTANNKKVPNVTVKVDFADRTPPVITTYLDSYPDLFLTGHTYGIPTYSVDDASATRAMKLYYKSQSGERKEIDYEGLYFTVEENEGEYQFVFTAEDSVGNKSEITHVVPVDGPQTYVENRIAYFNEPFGVREVRLMNNDTNAMTAEYSTEVAYGSEEGSTIISINEQTGWALIELRYPTIENLSNYDSFTWRVYNPNDWALIFGLAWTAYQRLEPKTWTEFTLPTSYFRNHGDDSLQTPNYMPVYEDNISGLTFVVMHELFSQNGDVAEGTKVYFSALDAYRAEGNDLRIAGDTYNLVYDQTDYDLDDYRIVNRAGVTVYSANVTLDSAIAPDGTQAIVENGKLKFNQEGIYTFVYKGEYTGNDYDKTIDDLTVKIVNGGSLANADKGDAIDGCAVYADRKYGIKQIASTKNVAVQIDEETKYGTESASMKFTVISDGVADVVFNTESVSNPENYEAIQFRVFTKNNNVFRIWVTHGENSEYLGADSVTCFDEGDGWVTVVCYLKDVDRSKLGIHFFNTYATGSVIPADTEIFVSNIHFVDGGFIGLPQDSTVNLITQENAHTVPATITGRNGVVLPVTVVSVKHNGSDVVVVDKSFTLAETGEYTVTYLLNVKEYHYTITVTAEMEDIELVYDPNQTTYTVSEQLTVTGVKLNGAEVAREGNVITLGEAGEYVVTATASSEEVSFKITYCKPQEVKENVAVYAETFGTQQVSTTSNLTVTAETDADKGNVLKFTVSATGKGAAVLFHNKSMMKDYDYVSFWIKTEGVALAGITQKTTDPFGAHVASVDGTWKKVSFHFLSQSQTWWYDGDAILGLYLFNGYNNETLAEGACVYITDICFEKGSAQIENVTDYNMAKNGAEYTLPTTVVDNHGVDKDGAHTATLNVPVTILGVKKGDETLTVTEGKMTFTGAGVYTVSYKAYNTEYHYTITVINVPIENVTLYYSGNETYTFPSSVNGKAVTVTGVTYGDGQSVEFIGNAFTLTAGTPTAENDTHTYVYTVTYTLDGDDTVYSYTLTYHKPTAISGRPVDLDTGYGLNHQLTVDNATAVHSDSVFVQVNDGQKLFGDGSVELTVQEDGVVWLHFDNVIWDSSNLSLRIAFSTSLILRYGIYDAEGKQIGEDHCAFASEANTDRWSFEANGGNDGNGFISVGNNDMSSFSIKLFCAYGENEALSAGTKILVAGLTAHPW